MTVREVMESLSRHLGLGTITEDDEIQVRDPDVSEDAMEAGSNGYVEVDEMLYPRDGRVILLGAS